MPDTTPILARASVAALHKDGLLTSSACNKAQPPLQPAALPRSAGVRGRKRQPCEHEQRALACYVLRRGAARLGDARPRPTTLARS